MWPRHFEIAIALWLAMSPFIFRYSAEPTIYWWNDLIVALLIVVVALACYKQQLEKLHLLNAAIGIWLVILGAFWPGPWIGSPDNHVAVGLLLVLLGIMPSRVNHSPRSWQRYLEQRQG